MCDGDKNTALNFDLLEQDFILVAEGSRIAIQYARVITTWVSPLMYV